MQNLSCWYDACSFEVPTMTTYLQKQATCEQQRIQYVQNLMYSQVHKVRSQVVSGSSCRVKMPLEVAHTGLPRALPEPPVMFTEGVCQWPNSHGRDVKCTEDLQYHYMQNMFMIMIYRIDVNIVNSKVAKLCCGHHLHALYTRKLT